MKKYEIEFIVVSCFKFKIEIPDKKNPDAEIKERFGTDELKPLIGDINDRKCKFSFHKMTKVIEIRPDGSTRQKFANPSDIIYGESMDFPL